jgi:hypothetical protein
MPSASRRGAASTDGSVADFQSPLSLSTLTSLSTSQLAHRPISGDKLPVLTQPALLLALRPFHQCLCEKSSASG